jgi:hypothetical protein
MLTAGQAWGINQAERLSEPEAGSSLSSGGTTIQINRDNVTQKQIQHALVEKGDSYIPRTKHLDTQGRPLHTNRLILEDSPYLLQHAHNPVDWHAWGPEAFALAKQQNKPIFLSIGYSTCHWCHVMEEESFENPQIALLLNELFIPIKVDREQRPDVDATYMLAVMLINGQGGWPMSSFLTPEGKTFYGATYFPPAQFTELINRIASLWRDDRPELLTQANRLAEAVEKESATQQQAQKLKENIIQQAVTNIMSAYDDQRGGFSQAPKFPNEALLYLLLDQVQHSPDKTVLSALENTLAAMARGGIYDQIGGGFHRYSTDNIWQVPHFEKMLYNQALLSRIYLGAWRLTGNPAFERVIRETLDYVLREMTAEQGGFYSATDADSEGEEGLFFLWTPDQINASLDKADAAIALDLYGITQQGNFEGQNVLNLAEPLEVYAARHQLDRDQLVSQVAAINKRLREKRSQRIHPLTDTKIITAWNGMMITALAQAGDMLSEPTYLDAALRAADFIWQQNRDGDFQGKGKLWRANLDGSASIAGSQEDYAYLAESLLMLFDVTGEQLWLQRAQVVTEQMLTQFWDKEGGGFFMGVEEPALAGMGRIKDGSDGAIPSGNSVALHVLQKLARRTDNLDYSLYAEQSLAAFASKVMAQPEAFPYMLSAANDMFNGETGSRQYAAHGKVVVNAVVESEQNLALHLTIQPGWHINAHQPLQEYLIPTVLKLQGDVEGWRIEQAEYPQAKLRKLGFQQEQLALYEGQFKINVALSRTEQVLSADGLPPIELHLQACSDSVCLAPEKLQLLP